MADPENHTLQLLREFRREFKEFHKEFGDFRVHTDERFEELARLFAAKAFSVVTPPPTWTRDFRRWKDV